MFSARLAYVALSSVCFLSGLYLAAFNPKSIMVSHSCIKEINRLRETYRSNLQQYPLPLQTRTGTKRKLTSNTQNDQPKPKKTNKKTPEAPSKPVPRNRKRRASSKSKLEDETPDKKKKKRGSDGHNGKPDQTLWRYHSVDVEWQHNACNVMGQQFHGPNTVAPGGLDIIIIPSDARAVNHIRGNGNCLFHSFSYHITGSEDEHEAVRAAIVGYMLTIGRFLVGFQIPAQCTV